MQILKSKRLEHLRYDIRGPIYEKALELESQGYKIINLNIGNPAPFGLMPLTKLSTILFSISAMPKAMWTRGGCLPPERP
jgi:aspartate/methionine/tyrosine aminotransferase